MSDIHLPEDQINQFKAVENASTEDIKLWISEIEKTPLLLRNLINNIEQGQLDKSYRLGGWTIKQIVHHIADNNMNAYFRFKRTLTEDNPVIPSYNQDKWAELEDYNEPIEVSLKIIESVYSRFVVLLKSLNHDDYKRLMKSETFGIMSLETALQRFLWHDRHHMGQIQLAMMDGKGKF